MKQIKISLCIISVLVVTLHASESIPQNRYQRLKAANQAFTNEQVIAKFPDLRGKDDLIDQARKIATHGNRSLTSFTKQEICARGSGTVNPGSRERNMKIKASNMKVSKASLKRTTGDSSLTDAEIHAARCECNKHAIYLKNVKTGARVRKLSESWKRNLTKRNESRKNKEKLSHGGDESHEDADLITAVQQPVIPPQPNRMALSYLLN